MLEIFDRSRRRVAIAENAYAVRTTRPINSVWNLSFSLPYTDPKKQYCQPFHYVRWNGGELYRIMPETLSADDTGGVTYQCEHVLATLIDNVLFGYHVVGNLGTYTADCIRYLLDRQQVQNWVLSECDFRRQFEYGWEQESLLSALFSIANPLSEPYIWTTDTSTYPWRLSLKRLETSGRPELYVRRSHNMVQFQRERDPQELATRLYPLGYGEGVNQLTIKEVNGGVPYLQSPPEIIAKYGIIERVWIDRRYEDAASLKSAAEAMLKELQEPLVSYEIGFQELNETEQEQAAPGKRVRILYPELGESVDTYITEVTRDYGDLSRSTIKVANRSTSIASSVADLADRQRIEQAYAQGATQLYAQALQANCDRENGAVMDFFIPSEMRIINKVLVKVRMDRFRAYSQSTESEQSQVLSSTTSSTKNHTSSEGGSVTATSSAGGALKATSSDGGGVTATSTDGGGTTATSTNGGGTTITSTDGGALTATSSDGGDMTATSSDGGALTATSTDGGALTATSTDGGALTATSTTSEERVTTSSDAGEVSSTTQEIAGTGSTDDRFVNLSVDTSAEQQIWVTIPQNPSNTKVSVKIPGHSHSVNGSGTHAHNVRMGVHSHEFKLEPHSHTITISGHSHSVDIPSHNHNVSIPNHRHDVRIPSHRHDVTIRSHSHKVTIPNHRHDVTIKDHSHKVTISDHRHTVTIKDHNHSLLIPNHDHTVYIPAHTHTVNIPGHSHNVTIPAHGHTITPGIFKFGDPQSFSIYVNGQKKRTFSGKAAEIDITNFLLGSDNKIPRGSWLSVEVRPDDLAYISIDLIVQGFVQSRGDNTV